MDSFISPDGSVTWAHFDCLVCFPLFCLVFHFSFYLSSKCSSPLRFSPRYHWFHHLVSVLQLVIFKAFAEEIPSTFHILVLLSKWYWQVLCITNFSFLLRQSAEEDTINNLSSEWLLLVIALLFGAGSTIVFCRVWYAKVVLISEFWAA